MRIKKIGLLTGLLFMSLVMGYKTPIHAALPNEPVKEGVSTNKLTDLKLTALEEPKSGVPFDTSATIVTAEGVTWDIPVIWVDEYGNRVTVPVAGKKYYPAFVFYVPDGYQVANVDGSGMFSISLPDFVVKLIGPQGLVFAADPTADITYMFPVSGVPSGINARTNVPSKASVPESDRDEIADDSSDDEDEETPVILPYISAKVRMYCADSAINTLGNDFLEGLIDLLKESLVPQAANLLREKFPQSFGAAEPETELSSNIGLYIYYVDGEIMGNPTPPSALAFNYSNANEYEMSNILGLDASSFTEYDAVTGKWEIPYYQKANLDYTIVHELLHSFMFDYTRYGMFDDTNNESQGFPLWFKEGTASVAENDYMYRIMKFLQFSGAEVFDAFHELGIEGIYPDYSTQNVLEGYLNPYFTTDGSYFYTPGDADPEEFILDMTQEGTSSYASGYLAVAYLGYMDALHNGKAPIDAGGSIDVDVIRGGVDDVLKRLHGTESVQPQSLDEIICEISGQRYQDTDNFTTKFIKGTAEASGEYFGDTTDDGTGSLTFVSAYLTWLDSQSNIREGEVANGSLLYQQQDYDSPLDWDQRENSEVYQIPDRAGMIVSSVDLERANLTGGKGSVGNGTQDYTKTVSDGEDESTPEQVAAKTENTLTLAPEEEPVTDEEGAIATEEADDAAQIVLPTEQESEDISESDDSDTAETESLSEEEEGDSSLEE